MTYQEMLENARENIGPYCKACPVCNGRACGNKIPGPGAKGVGDTAIRNYDAWQRIRLNMDTLNENKTPDTSFDFFGLKLSLPVLAGPVGAVKMHYGQGLTDTEYNNIMIAACCEAGILAMTGDGVDPVMMQEACKTIKVHGGKGIPTVKPWDVDTLKEKFRLVKDSDSIAFAMDVDAAGLPFLQNLKVPAGSKTVGELSEIVHAVDKPFIAKGIMTVKGALKALEAGAAGIVVSNHGGRVLDQCPATAEVLAEIADAVGGRMMILVDGGIRSGTDIYKALALGADAVIIARPYVTAMYGGRAEGIKLITDRFRTELADTMRMCGTPSLKDIGRENVYMPKSDLN